MTLVAVNRHALDALIREMYDLRQAYDAERGMVGDPDVRTLDPRDELVTLAVQAGIVLPGAMKPGTLPPAPPAYLGRLTAPTYRGEKDHRLRCAECGKVVYGNNAQAGKAAGLITTDRQAMRTYLGPCGHYHLSRVKGPR